MKLHLPLALRAALLAVLCVTQAWAERTLTIDGVEQENWYGIIDDDLGGTVIDITLSGDIPNTVELQSKGYIASSKGSSATITVNGGEFKQSGGLIASSEGSSVMITVNGGEFTQSDGSIGGAYQCNTTITVNKGGEFTQSGGYMGYGGRLEIIVNEGGIFTHSGGDMGSPSGNTITVKGQFVQKGGNIACFNSYSVTITVDKDGEFTQEGGFIAYADGANAAIIVNDGGKFTQSGWTMIAGYQGNATITVNGGEFTQRRGYIAYGGGANATIIVNGGEFTQEEGYIAYADGTNATITVNDGGEFTSTGGHLGYDGSVTIDVKGGGEFSKSGGYISNGTMTVEEYGTFTLSGDATVSSGNTITVKGQFVQEGGTIKSYTSSVVSIGESGVYTMSGGTNGAAVTVNHGGSYVLSGSAEVTGEVTLKGGSLDLGNLEETDATIVFQDGTMSNAQNYAGTLKVETDEETTARRTLDMAGINGSKLRKFSVQSNEEGVSLINFAAGNTLTLSGKNTMAIGSANLKEDGALFQFADNQGSLSFAEDSTIQLTVGMELYKELKATAGKLEVWLTNAQSVGNEEQALKMIMSIGSAKMDLDFSLQHEDNKGWKLVSDATQRTWFASIDGTAVTEANHIGNYDIAVVADQDLTLTLENPGTTQVHNLTDAGTKKSFSVSGAAGVVVELENSNSKDTTFGGDITVTGGTELRVTGSDVFTFSGTLSTDGELVIQEGSFNQSGGYIAYEQGSNATITVNGGGTFTQDASVKTNYIAYDSDSYAKITVNKGGLFEQKSDQGSAYIAHGTGSQARINVDGGTFTQQGGQYVSIIARYGSADIEVSNDGVFTQEAGGEIAYRSGSSATITVGNGGEFTSTGGHLGYEGSVTIDVKGGGNFSKSGGYIRNGTITVEKYGTFTLSGDADISYGKTMTVNGDFVQEGGTFNQWGSTTKLTIEEGGVYAMSGGTYNVTTTVNAGGNYNYSGGTIGASSFTVEDGGYFNLVENANYTHSTALSGDGHITVNDSASYDLDSGTGSLDIIMHGGSLTNAGSYEHNVRIDTGADYSGEVSLGGLEAAHIESVTIAGGDTSITEMASGSTLSFHEGDSITVGSGHMSDAGGAASDGYILNFTGDSGNVAFAEGGAVVLNFAAGVFSEDKGKGDFRKEIWLTNGTIDGVPTEDLGSWLEEHFVLGAGLEDLSLAYIEGVNGGGKLLLYGNADGIWIASRNGQEVTSVTRLDKFKQVQADRDLTLNPGEAGTMHVRQLQSGRETGDLIVESVAGLTVQLDNEHTDEDGINGNTVFGGNIRVEEGAGASAVLEKTGSALLTVQGNVTTGGVVRLSKGALELNGEGNSIGTLDMNGGELDVTGTLRLIGTTAMTETSTGTITGTGDLKMDTGASLTLDGSVSYSVSNTTLEGEAAFTNNSSSAMQGDFRLQDSARLSIGSAGASGSVSLQDKAVLDLGNAGASGLTVTMQGGQLANGGSFQGHVAVQTGSSYSGEIKLGGVDAACITSINTQGSGTYLSGLKAGSTLTLSGENSMAVSTDNLNYAGSSNTCLIQFEGSRGTIAFAEGKSNNVGFLLNLDAEVIAALRKQEDGVELYFTNGQITGAPGEEDEQEWRDWVAQHIHFTETLENLGYAVVGIDGGKLLISGSTEDIYFVTAHGQTVTSPLRLGRYDAVVVDKTLTLDFNVAEEPAENSVIHNLRSGASDASGDLLVDKSGEKALTLELNNTKDSEFLASSSGGGGNLKVTVEPGAGALTLIKTGEKKLTVGGNLTTPGSLEVQEGTLEVGGADSSVGSLEVKGGAGLVLSSDAKLHVGNHQLTTGAISGPGELDWDGELSLSGAVELDGVKLDMEKGESLKIDGVTVRMGNGQIGGMSATEVNVTNGGKFELEGGNIDSVGTRVSVDGAGFTQSGGYIGEGAQFELKNKATLTQSGGEITGGIFSLSGGTTMSQGGEISGGTFTLNAGTTMTQSGGEIKGGIFRLSGEGVNLTQDAGGIISGGEFALSGGASLRQKASNNIISGGTFTLSGAGTSITQMKGTISGKASFTLNAGTTMTQNVGKIEGGTFRLSGEGANLTQDAGGIISGGEFTLSGGASLWQEGSASIISGGTFTLSGAGTSIEQRGGTISGSAAFILNAGTTMTQSGGKLTGGTYTLSGTGTSFTQSAGSISEGVEITLKNGAKLALSGGSMGGSVTLEGTASSYNMGGQAAGGSVLMKGGKLENAEEFAGKLSIETGDTYTAALELGGVDAARITKVVMGSSQTELHGLKSGSTLTFRDSASKMVVGSEHIAQGDVTGTAMVQFEGDGGQIAFGDGGKLLLRLESEVLTGIEGQKEIVFTNGSFSEIPGGQEELEEWLAEHFVLETGMEGIEVLLLDDVHGGRLVLTGSTSGIWLTSRNGQSVDVVDRLNHYSAVVVDKDLTLKLPATEEETPTIVKQLQNREGQGDFIIQTEGGATVNHTVQLNNVHTDAETQNGDTDFYGNIRVEGTGLEAAALEKTGNAQLTMHGDVTTGGVVQLSEGTLKLAGAGNGIGALAMNGGKLDVAGTLRLTGSTAMTEASTGTITGEGTVELGSGASLTLAGTVSYTVQNTGLTGGAQMKQQGESSITGGNFQLSGTGTVFVQEGGSISETNFTLKDGATMQVGGEIVDGTFTLNAGTTMTASGSITGGGFELTGAGTIFTQSGGSMDEKTSFSLKDGAKLVLAGGSMAGSVTLEGAASVYDMGGQTAGGNVLMKGGKLENAGEFAGKLSIQTAENYSGEIKLGGVDAARITNIQLGAVDTYLTELKEGSTLTLSGENSLVVDSKQFNYTDTSPTYLIRFENESGSVTFAEEDGGGSVGVLLKLSAKEIATLRQLGGEAEFYFTNGDITGAPGEEDSPEWREWVASHFHFTKTLESLGFAVVGIDGGKLRISGSTADIYVVTAHGRETVTSPLQLGRYAAVVVDADFTLDCDVDEEPAENSVIHNLRSGKDEETGDLLVKKSGEYELTLELNNTTESALSPYRNSGGNLTVTVEKDAGELTLIKTGEKKLTVGGNLTTPGALEVQEGRLEVGGAASSVGSLEVKEGAGLVLSDNAKLTMGNHEMATGSISGSGELDWDGELSLSGTVELDGVKLDMEDGESLKINGVTVRMGNGQIGGMTAAEVDVTNGGKFELEGGNIDSVGTENGVRVSVDGAAFTQSGGYIGEGAQFEIKNKATLTQSGGEIKSGTFTLEGKGASLTQEAGGSISGGTFTLSEGATMSQSGIITGGTYGLSGEGTSFTQTDGSISGVEFTLNAGTTMTQRGGKIAGGTFRLSGKGTSLTQGAGGIISDGEFTLSGGATMSQSGSITGGTYKLSGGTTMSHGGAITGGTFTLSDAGSGITQTGGTISGKASFTLNAGTTMTQNGGEIESGVFTLEGKGASLTQGASGSISGGAFTLSGGATMTASGSIAGGVFALSGEGTSFTQSAGSISEGVEITLKNGAKLALSGGSMSGSVTMEGTASSYNMGGQTAGGSVVMKGGKLENAGAFEGKLSIETATEYTEALELGEVDAARITKVVMGSSQTELHGLKSGSTLTFRDGASKMVVGSEHIAQGDVTGTAMVQFEGASGNIAFTNEGKLLLHLESEVLEGIEGQKEIVFTNGSFSGMPEGQEELEAWLAQHFVLESGMEGIEVLLLDDVHGGRLVLTGSTSGIWITSRNGQSVDVVNRLNHYSAVVVDKDLTLTLPTTPEEMPTIIHQLQNESDEHGDLLVHTENGATANHTVQLNNVHTDAETQNGDTDFYGNINVEGTGLEAATLEKTGDAQLTVHGDVTTGGEVRLSEGTLKLAGAGNGIGALAMNGGELDVADKLRLTGSTALTGSSTGTITGEGTVEMGSGASLTLAGTVSYTVQNTKLAGGAQMRQEEGSSISGGSFQLSGEGTTMVQEGGSISKTDFSLTEGAAMEAGGSVAGGSFVLKGEGAKFTQTGGSLSGVAFELSEGATMAASGSITGGSMELTGAGTIFTQSEGSMDEKTSFSLKGGAKLVLTGGSMAGSVTLEGAASVYDMGGQAAGGNVLMKGGRLENAGNYTGSLTIETDGTYTGELGLGGLDAARITNIQLGAAGTYLTELKEGSTLTLSGENSLVVDCNQFNYTDTTPTYLIRFENESGSVTFAEEDGGGSVGVLLKLSAKEIATLRQLGGEAEFYFTNGDITGAPGEEDSPEWREWVASHFHFTKTLESLGFAVVGIDGGKLLISGSTADIYIVTANGQTVTSPLQLGRYAAVVVDKTLTLDFHVDEKPEENSVIHNLRSGKDEETGDLLVNKSGEYALTLELNNTTDSALNPYRNIGGNLTVTVEEGAGELTLIKTGEKKLTVGGNLTTPGALEVQEGRLEVGGAASSVGSLEVKEGAGLVLSDNAKLTMGNHEMATGSISGSGELDWDGELSLSGTVELDGVKLDMEEGESLKINGVTVRMGDGQIGGGELPVSIAVEKEGENKGSFTLEGGFLGSGEVGAVAKLDVKGSEFVQEGGVIQQGVEVTLSEGATMEQSGGRIKGGTITLEGATTSLTQGEQGGICGGSFTLSNGASFSESGVISDGTFSLSGTDTKMLVESNGSIIGGNFPLGDGAEIGVSGGMIRGGTFTLSGEGVIMDCKKGVIAGGDFTLSEGATLTQSAGSITDGTFALSGGATIRNEGGISGGKFTLSGKGTKMEGAGAISNGAFTLSKGATMSQSGNITGGTYGLSGEGTSFTQTNGSISGVEFTMSEGATLTQSAGSITGGTFTLSGTASLRNDGKISGGSFSLDGSGAEMEGAGEISGGDFTLSEGATMSQSGVITGGTYGLSGEGTSFTQADGSISGVEFSLREGAALTQNGGEIRTGTFFLNGAGLTQGTGGRISGGEFTLSGGATMTTSGSITGGTFILSGEETSFTQSAGSISEGVEITLKDGAKLALSGGSMAGSVTMEGTASSYDMGGQEASGSVLMKGGRLENAGAFAGKLSIETATEYTKALELGEVDAARITKVVMDSSRTELHGLKSGSTLTFRDGESKMVVGSEHIAQGDATGTAMVQFEGASGNIAFTNEGKLLLHLESEVLVGIEGQKEIVFTNGSFSGMPEGQEELEAWLAQHFGLESGIGDIKVLLLDDVHGGRLVLTGSTSGIWITSRNGQSVDVVDLLNRYSAVVVDEDLTLTLPTTPEEMPTIIHQLQNESDEHGDLRVHTENGATANHTVQLNNVHTDTETQNGNTDFYGNIRVEGTGLEAATLEKTGDAQLTVHGDVTTGGVVRLSEGTLKLAGSGNSVDALAMNGGKLDVADKLRLTGSTAMTKASTGTITGEGTVELGSGASLTLAGAVIYTVQNTKLAGGAQMRQERGSSITGGSFQLSETGTAFVQEGGSISDTDFSLTEGAAMEAGGSVTEGSFVLRGEGAKFTQTGGSLSGVKFELSEGATMETRGSITGGGFELTGSGTIFTQSEGSMDEGTTISLQGGARLVLAGGSMAGSVTLEGAASVYNMGGQTAGGSVVMKGGKLEHAGEFAGELSIQTAESYSGEIKLGGVDAARITNIQLGAVDTYLTELKEDSTLTLRGENSLVVDCKQFNYTGTSPTYLIRFENESGSVTFAEEDGGDSVGVLLKLSAKEIATLRQLGGEAEFYFTNGDITGAPGEEDSPEWREWVASHFHFTKTLESLGFAVVGIDGGKLRISGSTADVYLVSVEDDRVDSPLRLGRYEAVVVDTDLTLDFHVDEEPEENSVIHNLRSGAGDETGDLLVKKSGEYALTLELNNITDSALNPYRNIGGNLTVTVEEGAGELTLIKTGTEKLTVGGNLTTPGSLEVQEGRLEVGGAASSVGELKVEEGAGLVLSGGAKLHMGNHEMTTGSISGPGELNWDGELSLSGTVGLDDVTLDMEEGERLKIDGVTVRMGDGQIGGGESPVGVSVGTNGSFTLEGGFLGSGEVGAVAELDVKGSEFVQEGGVIQQGAEVTLSEGATMEQSGGRIKGGTITLEGDTTSLTQGEQGRICGGSFTLSNGASLRNDGKISGGSFSLSGSGTEMEGAGEIRGGDFALSEGATMSQRGVITGGTYGLSGEGTGFTQTDGSISGVEFTMSEGATLTQSAGSITDGTFTLSGTASLRNGGKISGGSFSLKGSGAEMEGSGEINGGAFALSEGATMSQSGVITGGTYGLSGEGTSFTQADGCISGVEFTVSEGAMLTQNGGEIQTGAFSLNGAGLTQGAGGNISGGSFTLSGGATMKQSGVIAGGTYELSGEGTGFTQANGSISGVKFSLREGATLTQNGGEIQTGTFSFNGAGLTQGTGGSISGGEFTLSNGATMETRGSITGGSMELSGTGTGLMQSGGSIGEDVQIMLKDGAGIALSGGSMAGSVTMEGTASSYDMGNQAAGGSVLMKGGRLENAGAFEGKLSLETAKEYTAALELGGVDAARITKVVMGSSRTELHGLKSGSTLTFRDGESKMVVGVEHVYREGQAASSMVQFREGNGQIAFEGPGALQLHLNSEVLEGIDGNGIEGQLEILFTNGSFSGMPEGQEESEAWLKEHFVLEAGMEGIKVLLLDDVHGGRLVLTGSTSGIWITSRNGQSVDVADLLNRYSAVIVDEGLTLTLPTTPEETPTIIHQLRNESDEHGDLLVQTEAGATANHTVQLHNAHTNEHQNNGDTHFFGNIRVDGTGLEAATLEKTGNAQLNVHGDVTTGGTVQLSEGTLKLAGAGNGIGALAMNGGKLDVAGKLRLTGSTAMTETSTGSITGEGTVELGSGASLTLAGAVSYTVQNTELAGGAQMRQERGSSITGGSFQLSGTGTTMVQEGGSISKTDFSLTEGAAMEAGGSVTGGSFVLRGEDAKFTQTGGSLSGVKFELSEGATMETRGSITGGGFELSGAGTIFTQSGGSMDEKTTISLQGGAKLVLAGGSMAGSVTLEGAASVYNMGGQTAGGSVVMKGGKLESAGNYTGSLTIETDDTYTGELGLGGVDAARITDVQTKGEVRLTQLKEGSTLTLHGDHSMRVAVYNTNYGEQEAQALIEFNGTGGRVALEDNMTLLLDLNADVLAGLRKQKNFELLFTNGNFVMPSDKDALTWVQEHFTFREVLEKLGFVIESVEGGTFIISGSTEDVYVVGEDGSVVDSALQLGRYKGVIVDENLTLDLDVQEDAAENSVLRNVDSLGKQTDLNIEKSGSGTITVELHNDEDTDTELGGDITVSKDETEGTGSADLLKSGSGKLTVGGELQTEDNLTVADGTLALEGQRSGVGSLNLGGVDEAGNQTSGELQVNGTLTLTGDSDMRDDRGSITGKGRLAVDGNVQLGEGVKMDGVALDLGSEGSLTASGELHLQGVNGQGSLSGRDVTVQGSGGSFGGTLAGSLTVAGRGAQQTLTGEAQGRDAELHVQDGGTLTLQGARVARSEEGTLPSVGEQSYGSVENGQRGTLRIEAANEEASGRGGAGIHVERDIVFRDDSTTELVFNMNSDQLWDEHDATMLETDGTIYIEDNAHFVLESLGEGFSPKHGDLVNVKVMQGSKVVLGAYTSDDEASAAAGEKAGEAALYSEENKEVEPAAEVSPEISRNLDVVELRGLFYVYFTGAWLGVDESTGTVYLNGKYRTASLFNEVANSHNSHAGANLLWKTSQVINLFADEGVLSAMSARVADTLESDPAEARRIMTAVAGSTVTSLSAAQRDVMRSRMQSVRNHAQAVSQPYESIEQKTRPYRVLPVKGWKDDAREERALTRRNVRGLHAWVQGLGDFHEQHTRGDESGYRLNAWGGATGADLRLSEETVVGLSLSALYGDLTANASDSAKGDWDSYTVSLWGRTRYNRWAHTFVVSAELNDAKLNRTVNYGAGSYTTRGKTDGYSLGALYELSYDVPLNRDSTRVLQPFATASVMHGVVNGYAESSVDRTGLNVGEQDLTLANLALGARWLMLTNASKSFNRTIRTELRAAVAQDFGERRAKADVALQANPGYATGVYGSRTGSTALQLGGNVLIPVTGNMDMTLDANADLRAHSAGWNASVGVRFGF